VAFASRKGYVPGASIQAHERRTCLKKTSCWPNIVGYQGDSKWTSFPLHVHLVGVILGFLWLVFGCKL